MSDSSLDGEIKQLKKKLDGYSRKLMPKATANALNRIAARTKTQVARSVASKTKIPNKILKTQISINRATGKQPLASVNSLLRPIAAERLLSVSQLEKFKGHGTNRRGVRVAGRQVDSAFINQGKKSKKFYVLKRKGSERFPLMRVTIPIAQDLQETQLPTAKRIFAEDFQKELLRQMNYYGNKYD